MFKQIASLLTANTAVTILITGSAEAMTVTVIPKQAKQAQGQEALSTPLVLNGTADELDEGFSTLITKFTSARQSLEEQFEATAAILDAAKQDAAKKAVKGVTKSAKAACETPPEPDDEDSDDKNIPPDSSTSTGVSVSPSSATNLFS